MRPRALALSCIAIVVAAGGALSAYWLWSADRLAARIAAWSAEQRARGYEVSYVDPEIGGYPFELTARFERPRLASPRGWRWQGPSVSGRAALWDPFTIELDFSGLHRVTDTRGAAAALIEAEDESTLGDFVEDREADVPVEVASFKLLQEYIALALEELNDRERQVLIMRFGLEDGKVRTLEEVGAYFGVTRERVRQLETKALAKLRLPARTRELEGFLDS